MAEETEGNEETESLDDSIGQSFTQEDLNRVGTKERRQGKAAGQRELLESLGVESAEDLHAIVEARREQEEANKSELTRAQEGVARAQAEAVAAVREADTARHEATVMMALLQAGSGTDNVVDLIPMVKAEVGANAEEVSEAITEMKNKFPALFDSSGGTDDVNGDTGGNPDSDTGKGPKKKTTGMSSQDRARERLRQRHPQMFQDQ
jgi:hypothetical protein